MFCVFIYLTFVYNFCKKYFCCSLRSNVRLYVRTCTQPTFDLALVGSTAASPYTRTALNAYVRTCLHKFERITHTHTHAPARVRSNVLLYVRTYSILGQREQFFRSFFPLFPHSSPSAVQHPPVPPPSLSSLNPK
jgi:hypothetical protein